MEEEIRLSELINTTRIWVITDTRFPDKFRAQKVTMARMRPRSIGGYLISISDEMIRVGGMSNKDYPDTEFKTILIRWLS